jgi:juvenile hormone epoxide hydrolase
MHSPGVSIKVYLQPAVRPGLSSVQIGVVMRNLMQRLGFKQYYVQGGDFGYFVGSSMATLFPNEVLGFHTNMAMLKDAKSVLLWTLGRLWPSLIEKDYADRLYPISLYIEESGYFHLQATKPDSFGEFFRYTIHNT